MVTGLVFEAVLDAACWPRFLKASARELQARSAFIMTARLSPDHKPCYDYALGESAIHQYYEYFHHLDPWWENAEPPPPGQVRLLRGEELIADKELTRGEFYIEFLSPNNIRWMRALIVTPEAPGASPFIVSWLRGPEGKPFSPSDDDYIMSLAPSLLQGERLGAEITRARVDDGDGEEPAVFVMGPQGWLLQTNDRGRRMISQGLFDANGRPLRPDSQEASLWLHSHLNSGTLASGFRPVLNARGNAPGRNGRPGLRNKLVTPLGNGVAHHLEIRAIGRIGGSVSLAGAAILLVARPASSADTDTLAERTARMFSWTPTEFDTVWRLYQNASTQDIAKARNCSVETVRTHLKHAKRKAGVRRQVELVTLMMNLESGDL